MKLEFHGSDIIRGPGYLAWSPGRVTHTAEPQASFPGTGPQPPAVTGRVTAQLLPKTDGAEHLGSGETQRCSLNLGSRGSRAQRTAEAESQERRR